MTPEHKTYVIQADNMLDAVTQLMAIFRRENPGTKVCTYEFKDGSRVSIRAANRVPLPGNRPAKRKQSNRGQ
jgi:hypothetical protein